MIKDSAMSWKTSRIVAVERALWTSIVGMACGGSTEEALRHFLNWWEESQSHTLFDKPQQEGPTAYISEPQPSPADDGAADDDSEDAEDVPLPPTHVADAIFRNPEIVAYIANLHAHIPGKQGNNGKVKFEEEVFRRSGSTRKTSEHQPKSNKSVAGVSFHICIQTAAFVYAYSRRDPKLAEKEHKDPCFWLSPVPVPASLHQMNLVLATLRSLHHLAPRWRMRIVRTL